jgi:hypothetical protein
LPPSTSLVTITLSGSTFVSTLTIPASTIVQTVETPGPTSLSLITQVSTLTLPASTTTITGQYCRSHLFLERLCLASKWTLKEHLLMVFRYDHTIWNHLRGYSHFDYPSEHSSGDLHLHFDSSANFSSNFATHDFAEPLHPEQSILHSRLRSGRDCNATRISRPSINSHGDVLLHQRQRLYYSIPRWHQQHKHWLHYRSNTSASANHHFCHHVDILGRDSVSIPIFTCVDPLLTYAGPGQRPMSSTTTSATSLPFR